MDVQDPDGTRHASAKKRSDAPFDDLLKSHGREKARKGSRNQDSHTSGIRGVARGVVEAVRGVQSLELLRVQLVPVHFLEADDV